MKKLLFSIASLLATGSLFANNIVVSNVSLSSRDQTNDFTLVNADVAWNNSWRTSTNESNWDGAWVFVKYRKVRTTIWRDSKKNWLVCNSYCFKRHGWCYILWHYGNDGKHLGNGSSSL